MKRVKLVLPKASKGWHFSRLFTVEMNDFDVERLLPSLFYLIVTRGRKRGPRKNDPTDLGKYLQAVVSHERVAGFDTAEGKRLMDRWLRAAVFRASKKGTKRGAAEQIDYLLPLTLLCYKTGFPSEIRRQRSVHVFLYVLLRDELGSGNALEGANKLFDLFRRVFGRNLRELTPPSYDSGYDGSSNIDIHSLLALCYLDGFQASTPGKVEEFGLADPALPQAARNLAQDVLQYLLAYGGRMPVQAITRGLMALINFGLFIYSVKLIHAVNHLVATGNLPPEMKAAPAESDAEIPCPEIYVDFTRQRGGRSDELARACVGRDLASLRTYIDSVLYLRSLDMLIEYILDLRRIRDESTTPNYLLRLISLESHPEVAAGARAEMARIREATLESCSSDVEKETIKAYFADVTQRNPPVKAFATLLSEAQLNSALRNGVSWYWSTGGLRKPFGILSGNFTGRRNWRYAPSDDLLATLVHVAMTERPMGDWQCVRPRASMRLSEFLNFLYRRYGLLVDRPPGFLDDATARFAAATNLEALKRRLRQMGFFHALSDDFNAQYLEMPVLKEVN